MTLQKSIQIPEILSLTIQNKTSCITVEVPDAPLTCIDLWCKGGSSFEKKGEEGIAHFLEHMIFKGSNKLREGEFDKEIETLSGSSNAATGLDDVHYYVLVPPKGVKTAIDLLTNIVLAPSLDINQYSLEKEVVLEEIAQHKDQPDDQIMQCLLENCWPMHAYGRSILGLEDSLNKSQPESMRDFHERQYKPENLALSIVGYIPKDIEKIITNTDLTTSKKVSKERLPLENLIKPDFQPGRKEIEVSRLESARITMAWELPPAKNQQFLMGADIATSILAEGRRSRLVHHLREELQIVESIDMGISVLEQGSLFLLEACCEEQNLSKVENEIHSIFIDCIKNPSLPKEVERAKQLVRNSICFGLELPSQIAAISASQILWGRHQSLLEPLNFIDLWESSNLQTSLFSELEPSKSFTLIARQKK